MMRDVMSDVTGDLRSSSFVADNAAITPIPEERR
jgi:hypothetical protein